jgi:hypothetical protein
MEGLALELVPAGRSPFTDMSSQFKSIQSKSSAVDNIGSFWPVDLELQLVPSLEPGNAFVYNDRNDHSYLRAFVIGEITGMQKREESSGQPVSYLPIPRAPRPSSI